MTQHPDVTSPVQPQILRHHRTLFLSDLHLGAQGCRADRILGFLQANSADRIYLVGDVLDLEHPLRPLWSPVHDRILEILLQRAGQGCEVHVLCGNHDPGTQSRLAPFATTQGEQTVHRTAAGQGYLVLHGDCADNRVLRWHICTRIGSRVDGTLRGIDAALRRLRRSLPADHRSLIERLIAATVAALAWGTAHERHLTQLARDAGLDGVICGHFHKPALHRNHGVVYANCGDWVDSFSALAEDADGRLGLVGWTAPDTASETGAKPAAPRPGFAAVGS